MVLSFNDYADLLGQPEGEDAATSLARMDAARVALAEQNELHCNALWQVRDRRRLLDPALAYPETSAALAAVIAQYGSDNLIISARSGCWHWSRGGLQVVEHPSPLPMTQDPERCNEALVIIAQAREAERDQRLARAAQRCRRFPWSHIGRR